MFIATYESRHYSFMAAGNDYHDCFSTMIATLRAHGAENHLPYHRGNTWWEDDDINMMEINPGDGYRDYTKIIYEVTV